MFVSVQPEVRANMPRLLCFWLKPRQLLGIVVLWAAILMMGCPAGGRNAQGRKRSETRLDLAKDFLRKGEIEAAETEAQKALKFDKEYGEVHHVLGLIDFMRGVSAHRLIEIDECLTGVDAEALQSEMNEHLLAADKHFGQASKLEPDYGEPWASRGTVATLMGRYQDAIEYLQRALGLPSRLDNIAVVRANLGWAYFHKGDLVSATKELLQANQFQPGMCLATYRLGRVYFARKEWEKAAQKFREVVGDSNCPIQDAHLFLMKTYLELGVVEELSELSQRCVALAPRSCIAAQCRVLATQAPSASTP